MDTGFNEFHDRRAPQPPQEPEGWHLKKEVNASIIISVFMIGVSCVAGYFDLRKDIELNKAETQRVVEFMKSEIAALNLRDARIELNTKETVAGVNTHLERMEAKLDRLIERRN